MREVTGPIVAIVRCCARCSSRSRSWAASRPDYRQFAVTISIAAVISGFVAMTLTPAAAMVLRREHKEPAGWALVQPTRN